MSIKKISLCISSVALLRYFMSTCKMPITLFLFSEYLYEGKADVVYLQVTMWSTSERLVVEILTIGAIQVRFLSFNSFAAHGWMREKSLDEFRPHSNVVCRTQKFWLLHYAVASVQSHICSKTINPIWFSHVRHVV